MSTVMDANLADARAARRDPASPRAIMRRRARSHVGFLIGAGIVLAAVLVAVCAPWLAPYDPYAQDLSKTLVDPVWTTGSWEHVLGTDGLGRDYLSRLIYGARVSLTVGFGAAAIAGVIGSLLDLVGGYFGGRISAPRCRPRPGHAPGRYMPRQGRPRYRTGAGACRYGDDPVSSLSPPF
ncbi:hypothetical protein [Pigmentiphaga sp. GD03639]|uniref:ABC transporter permease n=1 Tax=Pigmentiphaga sp. GD03639 TaxID=2975354 RepID=UPI003264675C